jgi:hypothetical protein
MIVLVHYHNHSFHSSNRSIFHLHLPLQQLQAQVGTVSIGFSFCLKSAHNREEDVFVRELQRPKGES